MVRAPSERRRAALRAAAEVGRTWAGSSRSRRQCRRAWRPARRLRRAPPRRSARRPAASASVSQSSSATCLTVELVGNGTSVNARPRRSARCPRRGARPGTRLRRRARSRSARAGRGSRRADRPRGRRVAAPDPRRAAVRAARTGHGSPLRRRRVAPARRAAARASSPRARGVAQQQRQPAAIDGEQRLVLALLAVRVALMRARRVPEHPPPAQHVEPVGECDPLARGRKSPPTGGSRSAPARSTSAPARRSRSERRPARARPASAAAHEAAIAEGGPFVRRPLAAAGRAGRIRSGRRRPSGVGGPAARAAVLPTSS